MEIGIYKWLLLFAPSQNCNNIKLHGVGPVDNRPSTDYLHHLTHDTWHMTHSVGWTFSQSFSSQGLANSSDLWLTVYWRYLDLRITQLINYKPVYRTAPASPGLLIIYNNFIFFWKLWDILYFSRDPSLPQVSIGRQNPVCGWNIDSRR